MNTNDNSTLNDQLQAGIDYCQASFNVSGQEVVNNYKCDQKPFSSADMWNIHRNSKQPVTRFTANQNL